MKHISKILVLTFFVGLSVAGKPLEAAAAKEPKQFMMELTRQALTKLVTPGISEAERERRFRQILKANFDVPYMAKFALGKTWKKLRTDSKIDEKATYLKLIEDYIVKIYAGKFGEYSGESLEIGDVKETKYYAVVSTVLKRPPPKQSISIQWRLKKRGGGCRVADIVVENVSMVVTKSNEFSSVLEQNNGDINALFNELRKKINQ